MKKILFIVASLAACLLAILACNKEPKPSEPTVVHVKNVSMTVSASELNEGDLAKLTVTFTPSDATDKSVTYKSDNPNVVAVDAQGNIMAVGPGSATITVTTKDGGWTASVTITVKGGAPVEGVSVSVSSSEMLVGETTKITVTITPADAGNQGVTFKSSDTSVVTVDSEGNVTAKGPGTATITVTTADGGKTATVTMTVTESIAVTGIEFVDSSDLKTYPDDQVIARVRVLPADATNKKYTWSASDPSIITVSKIEEAEGFDMIYIKGLKVGEAKLTVTTEDGGFSASENVKVQEFVEITSMTLSPSALNLVIDETAEVTAVIEPDNATAKYVTWSTTDPDVAVVQSTGLLKARVAASGVGIATIVGTSVDGKKWASCTVTVTNQPAGPVAVTGVTLNETSLDLTAGDRIQLVATVQPSNATNKEVFWTTSNPRVATVDDNGYVTTLEKGIATIKVQTKDGNKTASCRLNVAAPPVPVTGIRFYDYSDSVISIVEGEKGSLRVYVLPADASNKTITATSSDTGVLQIEGISYPEGEDYCVIGFKSLKDGVVTITATTEEGGFSDNIEVNVKKYIPVESIVFEKTSFTIKQGEFAVLNYTINPENASYQILDWSSSNPEVAYATGGYTSPYRIWGLRPGTVTITATSRVKDIKTASCQVTVLPATVSVPVTGLTLSPASVTMNVNSSYALTASVTPSNATNQTIQWSSDNTSVATVDSNGKVTAKAKGTANITAKTADGGFTKTCTVTVKEFSFWKGFGSGTSNMPSNPYTLNYTLGSNTQSFGDAVMFIVHDGTGYTYKDLDSSHYSYNVLSNDGCIAVKKESAGSYYRFWVDFKKAGSARVRFTYNNGIVSISHDVIFNVANANVPVTGISFVSSLGLSMYDGGPSDYHTATMAYTITPSNATNKQVTWKSSNTSVATVDSNGNITGKGQGEANITVTTVDGGYSATKKVTVKHFVEISSIVISPSSFTMNVNQTLGIDTYTINPSTATIKYLNWTSSDSSIVSVVQNSVSDPSNPPYVKALKKGTVTLTASARDGSGKKATCTITVQ